MKKFKCIPNCGKCCESLRGRNNRSLIPSLNSARQRLRKKGVYYLVPPEDYTIALFEWEKEMMERKARELDIEVNISPLVVVRDGLTDTYLGIQWNLDHDDCPFLTENKACKIYSQRPLACRTFPIMCVQTDRLRFEGIGWDWCPGCKGIPTVIHGRKFKEIFDPVVIAAISYHDLSEFEFMLLTKAVNRRLLLPVAKLSPGRILEDFQYGARPEGCLTWLSNRNLFRWEDFKRILDDVYERNIRFYESLIDEMPYI